MNFSGSFRKNKTAYAAHEKATPGLHEKLYRLLCAISPPPGSVLDLGSGTGAWGLRLNGCGYQASGVNLNPDECALPSIKADLNRPFADLIADRFDAITCIEVLEHLENPRNAIREAAKLLKPSGVLLISTPNASGVYSRFKFLVTGRFAMFDDFQYQGIGHITPLSCWQLQKMFAENGFRIECTEDFNATPLLPRSPGDIVKHLTWLVRPLMRGHVGTQNIIIAGRLNSR